MGLLTELYKYQDKGRRKMEVFLEDGGVLLADDMGLGKSIQVLAYYDATRKKFPRRPAVVVCPAGLRLNWQNEFRIHLGIHASILEGHKADPFELDAKAYIVGYDTIGDVRRPHTWAFELAKKRPYLLVVDESQMLKNRGAKRTKAVLAFARNVPKRIALSGTPLVNRPAELWTVLHMLRPDLYPSFMQFAMRYCRPERKPWGWEFKGADHMDELHHNLLMTMMIRRLKADVLKDLPPKVRHVVPLPLEDLKEYETAFSDFLSWMRKNYRHRLVAAQRAEVLTKTGYLLRLAAELKLPATISWIGRWLKKNPKSKLIVFGRHAKVLTAIHEAFKFESVIVTGTTPMKKRKESQALFQKSGKCRLFVGNIDAAGAGWNGTAARAVAFAEYDWRPGMHKQAEDRAHRIGQHGDVDCFYLTARGTIEEKLCQTIQEKQAVLDAVLDGGEVPDQLSVFDELMGALL